MKDQSSSSGQVLLIVVLISTVLFTVALSASQISVEETQVAYLEQQGKRAFAAADAGIDAGVRRLSPGGVESLQISDLGLGVDISGTVEVSEVQDSTFTTPLFKKDEQYTFYLSTYSSVLNEITGAASSDELKIELNSLDGTYCDDPINTKPNFAVEFTFIDKDTGSVGSRRIIDECNLVEGTTDEISFGDTIDPTTFPSHLLILRIIAASSDFSNAKLDVVNAETPANNWPPQGKTITSQAQTDSGVEKKIVLFQSYSQFISDFFVTSF